MLTEEMAMNLGDRQAVGWVFHSNPDLLQEVTKSPVVKLLQLLLRENSSEEELVFVPLLSWSQSSSVVFFLAFLVTLTAAETDEELLKAPLLHLLAEQKHTQFLQ